MPQHDRGERSTEGLNGQLFVFQFARASGDVETATTLHRHGGPGRLRRRDSKRLAMGSPR